MKKLLFSLLAAGTFFLTGCFETTQEVTIKEDGTGSYINTNDMSSAITIAKNMGAASKDKMPMQTMDSTFSMAQMADKGENLTDAEKELLKKGTMHVKINMEEEKFVTTSSFDFKNFEDIRLFNKVSAKMVMQSMKSQMGDQMKSMGAGDLPEPSTFDDYYSIEYSNGEFKRKLNKDKYQSVSSDQYLSGLKQAGEMGIPITTTYIIHLPRPAEKVEGKKAKLSDDKMTVTIKNTIDDFYDDPESLEFKVKF